MVRNVCDNEALAKLAKKTDKSWFTVHVFIFHEFQAFHLVNTMKKKFIC